MEAIQDTILQQNREAEKFRHCFIGRRISQPFKTLGSFENQVLQNHADQSVPIVRAMNAELEHTRKNNTDLTSKLSDVENKLKTKDADEEEVKVQLGDKQEEYVPMVKQVREKLCKVAEAMRQAEPLAMKMQHPQTQSKWDQVHEPWNLVENVLKDDDSF